MESRGEDESKSKMGRNRERAREVISTRKIPN